MSNDLPNEEKVPEGSIPSPAEVVPQQPEPAEIPPKPRPIYAVVQTNENSNLAVIRKSTFIDFKLDDLLNFIRDAQGDKEKADALIKYNEAVIENIKGFHPEVVEIYEGLTDEKKSAMLLFCKAVTDIEKQTHFAKNYQTEIDRYTVEIAEIQQMTGIEPHK